MSCWTRILTRGSSEYVEVFVLGALLFSCEYDPRVGALICLSWAIGYLWAHPMQVVVSGVRKLGENTEWRRAGHEASMQNLMGGRVEYRRWSDNALA
jgi:hypothetical protein